MARPSLNVAAATDRRLTGAAFMRWGTSSLGFVAITAPALSPRRPSPPPHYCGPTPHCGQAHGGSPSTQDPAQEPLGKEREHE